MKKSKKAILSMSLIGSCLLAQPVSAQTTGVFPEITGMRAQVCANHVNVRNHPDTRGRVVATIQPTAIQVIGQNEGWYQVWYEGEKCWIHQDYIQVDKQSLVPQVKVDGESVVAYGMEFIGTPYVWGGSDLNAGVDCSGFTQEIFAAYDVPISRVSYMQAEDGPTIDKNDLQCGDLVFFDTQGTNDGKVSHVGIYVGKDKFLHSDGTKGVMISSLSSPYYTRNYVKSIRIL